jgi:two-component system chemotaxis sensor kinase CheA
MSNGRYLICKVLKNIRKKRDSITMETHPTSAAAYGESNSDSLARDEISTSNSAATATEPPTLDDLVALVGELVIASATANLLARKAGRPELAEANSTVSLLVERIRDATLQMRMVSIGDTFAALSDAAEAIAKEQSKQVKVDIRGGNTDVDKSVIARISEPLLALLRHTLVNAIELPDRRVGLGKPPAGRIELNAYHDSASIVIEVSDDGAGLNVSELFGDAIQKGREGESQLSAHDEGSDPGHEEKSSSGEAQLIEIRNAFEELKGSVRVACELGAGSKYVVRLPLTLAIVDGFLTAVGKSSFVLPLDAVVECLELPVDHSDRDYLNLRGRGSAVHTPSRPIPGRRRATCKRERHRGQPHGTAHRRCGRSTVGGTANRHQALGQPLQPYAGNRRLDNSRQRRGGTDTRRCGIDATFCRAGRTAYRPFAADSGANY